MSERYDTVIVGGGTAGCVLANRLSADPQQQVALIEAGPDFGPVAAGNWPPELVGAAYVETAYDWGYEITVGSQRLRYTRGRVIGGSSAVNATGINWGLKRDYDAWAAQGNPGWSFADLLPYFHRVERLEDDSAPLRGRTGMLPVSRAVGSTPFLDALQQAYQAAGLGLVDVGGPEAEEGYGWTTRNVSQGRRVHAAEAYLDPVRQRPNLTIFDRTVVERLEWEGSRVRAVVGQREGTPLRLEAGRVVLAAGAIGDPLLLQRSGIGPEEVVRRACPDGPIHHLPGVGRNLHDHFGTRVYYRPSPEFFHLLAQRAPDLPPDGRFALSARVKSARSLDAYDLNIGVFHYMRPPRRPEPLIGALHEAITFVIFLVHLRGTGAVEITGPRVEDPPRIDPGFGENEDIEALARGIEWVRARLAHPALTEWIALEEWPGPEVNGPSLRSWVRNHLSLYYHPTGTCKMGPASDPEAVVDQRGKVHGFNNLFVADAAIMPTIPRGMIVLTVYAIAEKIAAELNRMPA
ncbi:MAG: FAD-dependent oxidoreductase [Chloroflexi bacterium]|nr:FAD-dependent oxidoreductase [Chloroflexota bacterium]